MRTPEVPCPPPLGLLGLLLKSLCLLLCIVLSSCRRIFPPQARLALFLCVDSTASCFRPNPSLSLSPPSLPLTKTFLLLSSPFRLSTEVTIDGSNVVVHHTDEKEPHPLALHHVPICVTFAIFEVRRSHVIVFTPAGRLQSDGVAAEDLQRIAQLQEVFWVAFLSHPYVIHTLRARRGPGF